MVILCEDPLAICLAKNVIVLTAVPAWIAEMPDLENLPCHSTLNGSFDHCPPDLNENEWDSL